MIKRLFSRCCGMNDQLHACAQKISTGIVYSYFYYSSTVSIDQFSKNHSLRVFICLCSSCCTYLIIQQQYHSTVGTHQTVKRYSTSLVKRYSSTRYLVSLSLCYFGRAVRGRAKEWERTKMHVFDPLAFPSRYGSSCIAHNHNQLPP